MSQTPEIASALGALDSTAVADGYPASAHVLRTAAMNGNRLRSKGHPLLCLPFDSSTAASENQGGLYMIAPPYWVPLVPGPIPCCKKPGLEYADARVVAQVSDDHTVLVQIATTRHPFQIGAQAGDANVVTCTGDSDNDYDPYSLDVSEGLRIAYPGLEAFAVFFRGDPTTSLMATATYGSPNTGTLSASTDYVALDHFKDDSAAWNVSGNTPAKGGHAVYFEDSNNNIIIGHRMITGDRGSDDTLQFWPALTEQERRMAAGATYNLVKIPTFRLAGLTIHAAARGAVTP